MKSSGRDDWGESSLVSISSGRRLQILVLEIVLTYYVNTYKETTLQKCVH